MQASVPELTKRIRSRLGKAAWTSRASRVSVSVGAP
jgi:hypothetical protein